MIQSAPAAQKSSKPLNFWSEVQLQNADKFAQSDAEEIEISNRFQHPFIQNHLLFLSGACGVFDFSQDDWMFRIGFCQELFGFLF